ncbi:FMN-binding negative transcriptional regulator [Micromonospora sp. IBHARD004]
MHAYGELVVHGDPPWVDAQVRRLTDQHEAGRTRGRTTTHRRASSE